MSALEMNSRDQVHHRKEIYFSRKICRIAQATAPCSRFRVPTRFQFDQNRVSVTIAAKRYGDSRKC
jgi:hypothetical protein